MPYIAQEKRKLIDICVENANKIQSITEGSIECLLLLIADGETSSFWVNPALTPLAFYMKDTIKPDGSLNYFLFKFAKYHIEPSYKNYKTFIGKIYTAIEHINKIEYKDEFREAAEWIRIKLLIPYEEEKLKQNGDV